ncbi:MAG TPA: molybdopterin-dependent oxidoreductase [Acidimicrobiales bacterium]|nr:molybdopterin-dependent oxidoreductase [Acidimicrobiales bacterium]
MTLPPGQRRVDGFPRFGTHLHHPAPAVPGDPVIDVAGAVTERVTFPVAELAGLPRTERTADFHCVAGWSATGLRWEGVAFATFYRAVVEPALAPGSTVTHVVFRGLDRFEAVVLLEDAMADDVLIADHLDGRPLDSDHGAPVRLVSPSQYGYMSTKHLCRIEVHTSEPQRRPKAATTIAGLGLRSGLVARHPRARVWEEERNPTFPNWFLRPVYRALIAPIALLSARGRRSPTP